MIDNNNSTSFRSKFRKIWARGFYQDVHRFFFSFFFFFCHELLARLCLSPIDGYKKWKCTVQRLLTILIDWQAEGRSCDCCFNRLHRCTVINCTVNSGPSHLCHATGGTKMTWPENKLSLPYLWMTFKYVSRDSRWRVMNSAVELKGSRALVFRMVYRVGEK